MSVRVITLPPGEDPDTFVRAHGSAGLEAQIQSSIDVFDRKIQILDRAGWFGELQKKRRALDRLLPTIRATSDEIMRDLYVVRASEVTGVDREILQREIGPKSSASTPAQPAPRIVERPRPGIRETAGDRRVPRRFAWSSAENALVRAMLQDRPRVEQIAERIGPDAFREPLYREIFAGLLAVGEEGTMLDLAGILEEDALALAQEMLGAEPLPNVQQTIDDSITQLSVRETEERISEIERLLPLASASERTALEEEHSRLVKQKRASGRGTFKAFRPGRAR
jgi:DNA primase